MFLDLSTVFMNAMQDLMGTVSSPRFCVAPPMASEKASPRRKWVEVKRFLPLLLVSPASVLAML